MFFFSCIWSIGGPLDNQSRQLFSTVFRGLLEKEFPVELYKSLGMYMEIPPPHKPYIFLIPRDNTVFDYRYIKEVQTIFINDMIKHSIIYQLFGKFLECFFVFFSIFPQKLNIFIPTFLHKFHPYSGFPKGLQNTP